MVDLPGLLQRCTFAPRGTAVDCGVSGGADSAALLALAVSAGCHPTAWHVDHGLRPGSAGEAEHVRTLAGQLDCDFRSVRVTVGEGPNLEARAREARHAVLPEGTLLGHTADDQAETVLLHMLRGAGPAGLSGMRPDARRPILALRREDTEAVCAHFGIVALFDPSNADPIYRRNRVRAELLPLLNDVAARDVVPILVRQADQQRAIDDLLHQLADAIDPTDVVALRTASSIVAAVALRRWVRLETGAEYGIDQAGIDRIMTVVHGTAAAAEVVGGWRVARTAGRLRIVPIC